MDAQIDKSNIITLNVIGIMIYTYINTYIVTKTNLDFRANSKNEIRVIK